MIVLVISLWVAWGILGVSWVLPSGFVIQYIAQGRMDRDSKDMAGFAIIAFLAWSLFTGLMFRVVS